MKNVITKLVFTSSADNIPVIAEVDPDVYKAEETDTWVEDSFLEENSEHPLHSIFEDVTEFVDFSERLDSQVFRIWKYKGKTRNRENTEIIDNINSYIKE